jgi:hypothetical protein
MLQRIRKMFKAEEPANAESAALDAADGWLAESVDIDTPLKLAGFVARVRSHKDARENVVKALHSAMRAAFSTISKRHPCTFEQAEQVGWLLVRDLFLVGGSPLRLINYAELLHPQFEEKFTTIPPATWAEVQRHARTMLANPLAQYASEEARRHWQSIADGNVPFGLKVQVSH